MTTETNTPAQVTPQAEGVKPDASQTLYPAKPAEAPKADAPAADAPKADAANATPAAAPAKTPETPKAETPAPAEKAFELKLPKDSTLDAARVAEIQTFAKEKGLNETQAQAILDRESNAVKTVLEQQQQNHSAQVLKWHEDVKNDPEIGGEAFAQNAHYAKVASEKFLSPEFRQILTETGFGNHPELVRAFAKIGKAMSSDSLVRPGAQAPGGGKKSIESLLYPNAATT